MGSLGWPEILLIVLAVLVLFGAKRIPEIFRSMGQGVKEFKKAAKEITDEIEAEPPPKHSSPAGKTAETEKKS
jgi:sec-independent protein translocase protein TatA